MESTEHELNTGVQLLQVLEFFNRWLLFQVFKNQCPFLERTSLEWIYIGPVLLLLAANAFFLISIFYVVVAKLRSSGQGEPADHQNWKAAKALLVIIPLLGITYLITILGKMMDGMFVK